MTAEEQFLEDVLTSLCCGDHCKAGTDHEGGCERWVYNEQAEKILRETEATAAQMLTRIAKSDRWLSKT